MRVLRIGSRLALGVLLMLHGLAHSPAVLAALGLKTFEGASPGLGVVLNHPGDAVVVVLGTVWLAAAMAFVLAGIGALWRAAWWPWVGAGAALVSLAMTACWWEGAAVGLVINAGLIVVLGGLLVAIRFFRWTAFSGLRDEVAGLPG